MADILIGPVNSAAVNTQFPIAGSAAAHASLPGSGVGDQVCVAAQRHHVDIQGLHHVDIAPPAHHVLLSRQRRHSQIPRRVQCI